MVTYIDIANVDGAGGYTERGELNKRTHAHYAALISVTEDVLILT